MRAIEDILQCNIQDTIKLSHAIQNIKDILKYSDDQPHYDTTGYERRKKEQAQQGQTTWTKAKKKYYEANKAEINKKRNEYRQVALARTKAQGENEA